MAPEPALAALLSLVEAPDEPLPTNDGREPRDVECRIALRWIEQVRARSPREAASQAPPARILVARDGLDFLVDGQRVALGGKPVLRRLLASLAVQRERSPGSALDVPALVTHVWPDERVLEFAARARLHACVMRLRRSGLGDALQQFEGGYALDPGRVDVAPPRS